jgi:hypothetical protein
MAKLKRIITAITSIAGIVIMSASGYNAYALETSWQEDYLEVIENYPLESYPDAKFELFYIDDDDIPELYVDTGKSYVGPEGLSIGFKLYTYYDDKAVLCLDVAPGCTLWIHSSKNGYFLQTYGVSAGYETFYNVIKLENGICNTAYEFYHDGRIMADGTRDIYTINGDEVSQEEFKSRKAEMIEEYSLISNYSDYIYRDPANIYRYDGIYKYLSDEIASVETTEPAITSPSDETDSSENQNDISSDTTTTVSKDSFLNETDSTVTNSSDNQNDISSDRTTTTVSKNAELREDSPKTGNKGIIGIGGVLLSALGIFAISKKRY